MNVYLCLYGFCLEIVSTYIYVFIYKFLILFKPIVQFLLQYKFIIIIFHYHYYMEIYIIGKNYNKGIIKH